MRFALFAALATLLVCVSASPAAPGEVSAGARASAVEVRAPGGETAAAAAVAAPPGAETGAPGFSHGNGAVSTGELTASAEATVSERGDAAAAASAAGVVLFGGEIVAARVSVRASAGASARRAGGSVALSSLEGVTVLGQAVEAGPNTRVPLADWGYAVLLEERVLPEETSFAAAVVGIHVYLTAEHGGLPAGTEIVVGRAAAEASVAVGAAPEPAAPSPPPAPPEEPAAPSKPAREPEPAAPGARPGPPALVLDPPAGILDPFLYSDYVFPVYGPASFGNDFLGPRHNTGWHHGNDVFAPAGAPVLAVADGELFLVGWNEIGGQRVWLRDSRGNEFYYAHLSAYSPLAFEGARVRAGDVIGFVGTSGDASGTPPHLHFELHPAQLRGLGYDGVVDPYHALARWRRLDSTAFGDFQWKLEPGSAPPAAAVLLRADDISTLVGLDREAAARVLAPPALLGQSPLRLRRAQPLY